MVLVGAAVISWTVAAAQPDGVVANPQSSYPEGPLSTGGGFYYAEMGNDRVMRWVSERNTVVWFRDRCGPTSVARLDEQRLTVLCHREAIVVEISPDGTTLAIIDRDHDGRRFMTPNASVGDGKGGVYFSSSGRFGPTNGHEGAVLYLDPTGQLTRVAEGINYANGVALSRDGRRLFVSEHLSRNVLVYDVGQDGALSGRRIFVTLDGLVGLADPGDWEVGPDGLAVDSADNLFIAEYGAGRLIIVNRDGALLTTVDIPERFVTGVAIGADERSLFVTAPGQRYPPYAGKVYLLPNPVVAAP